MRVLMAFGVIQPDIDTGLPFADIATWQTYIGNVLESCFTKRDVELSE